MIRARFLTAAVFGFFALVSVTLGVYTEARAEAQSMVWTPIKADDFGYADLIQCVFRDIEVEKKDQWFEATAPAFDVSPGETVDIKVRKRFGKGKETIYVSWNEKKDQLEFCKRPSSGSCNKVRIDGRRFTSGTRINFLIKEEARGVAACRYAQ